MKFYHGFQSCVDPYQKGSTQCSDVFLVTESDEMKKKIEMAAKLACDMIKRVNFWIFWSLVAEMGYKPT